MKNLVKVVADKKTGSVVRMRTITDKSTGETREVGVVMVQSKTISGLSALGRVSTRTAFITLEAEALEMLEDDLQDGRVFPIDGKIVIEETLTPYIKKDGSAQDAKINPRTNEEITYHGKPVYRNSFFSEDVNHADAFLKESASVPQVETEEAPE
jgi:hypothetical protein